MAPFFSIIVPTLDSEVTIGACLSNVLGQTFSDVEVVVTDGLSTDATVEIVAERARADPRVRWDSARDQGIYDAMNRGMSLARGQWLYFMGSDDVLAAPDTLARVASQARGHHRVMYGSVRMEGDAPWAADGSIYDGRFSLRKLMTRNICHQAMFYRRDFLESEVGELFDRLQDLRRLGPQSALPREDAFSLSQDDRRRLPGRRPVDHLSVRRSARRWLRRPHIGILPHVAVPSHRARRIQASQARARTPMLAHADAQSGPQRKGCQRPRMTPACHPPNPRCRNRRSVSRRTP